MSHVFNFHSADIFNFRLYHCHMFSIFIPPTSLTFVYIIDTSFQFSFRWHRYLLSISFSHVFNFHSTNIFNFRLYHCRMFSIFIPPTFLTFVYIIVACMFSIFIPPTSLTFVYIIDTRFQFSFRRHLYLLSISFSHVFNFHSTNIFNFRLYHSGMFSIFIPPTSLTFVYIIVARFQFSYRWYI